MTTTRVLFAAGCFLFTLPGTSRADSISFTYLIDQVTRCFEAPVSQCVGAAPFELRLTFDATGRIHEQRLVEYGQPTFSGVPFAPGPAMPENATVLESGTFSTQFSGLDHSGLWVRHSSAESFHLAGTDGWGVRLFGIEFLLSQPTPTHSAISFAEVLGRNGSFLSFYNHAPPDGPFTQIVYRGRSTLIDAPSPVPVPEPGSLLLLGSGLSAIAARKWRRRQH